MPKLFRERIPERTHTVTELVRIRRQFIAERMQFYAEAHGSEMPERIAAEEVDAWFPVLIDQEQQWALSAFLRMATAPITPEDLDDPSTGDDED